MKYNFFGIRKFLFKIKKRIQLWFRFGIHYRRRLAYNNYLAKITKSCKNDKIDFQLLSDFSTFCNQKRFTREVIEFFEKLKETTGEKTILNYFLLQNYIRQSRRLTSQSKQHSAIKAKSVALIDETLAAAFGKDYMSQIHATLPYDTTSAFSEILFIDTGWENFGFIRHQAGNENRSFLTKISISLHENNELIFYRSAPNLYPHLKGIIPAVADIRVSNDSLISFLTMEKAPGVAANKQQLQSLIDLHMAYVQQCKYDPSINLPLTAEVKADHFHLFISKSFHLFLSNTFHHIHKQKEFAKLNKWVKRTLLKSAYDPKIKQAVKALRKKLKKIKFYKLVSPEKHYALCHGDYYLSNVLHDKKTDKFTIIDWTQCTYGPRLLDIATLLRNQREHICSFREIEEMVLHRIDAAAEYDAVDKLLFLYASIVVSLLFNRTRIIKEDPDYFFLPAVEKCEELIANIVAGEPLTRARESSSKE